MIQVGLQEWQQMKAKLSQMQQQLAYLKSENQNLRNQLNSRPSIKGRSGQSQIDINFDSDDKQKQQHSAKDRISQKADLPHNYGQFLTPFVNEHRILNASLNDIQAQIESSPQKDYGSKENVSIEQQNFNGGRDSITISRKSLKSTQLKNLISSKKNSEHELSNELHLIQEICVFGPCLEKFHSVTFKNDERQFVDPYLYYPLESKQDYKQYGNYIFPRKVRIKPTQKSHVPMEGNKIIFKSSKREDCNIFIFQGNQKHPIKKENQILDNVNPSKWLYGIVLQFNDFVFKEVKPQKRSSIKDLDNNSIYVPSEKKLTSMLELDINSFKEQQLRMQTVSLKDIQLQSEQQRMYRSSFSLCLFTYFPFINYLQGIIHSIFDEVKLKRIQNFPKTGQFKDSDIFYFINELDFIAQKIKKYLSGAPVKMGKEISLNINQTLLHIDLSKEFLYKELYSNWTYRIIKLLDRDVFYQIYCMIMLEESVYFVCSDKKVLTFMVLLFSSMLTKPFIYPYPVISILFNEQLLQAPVTAIAGINESQAWVEQAVQDNLIDVQNKRIVIITQKQVRIRKEGNYQVPKSQGLKKVFSKFNKKFEPTSLTTILRRRNSLPIFDNINDANDSIIKFYAKLQLFYDQNILAYMPRNMKIPKKSQQNGDQVNRITLRNQFLAQIQKQYKRLNPNYENDPFIKQFIKTEIFSIYLMHQYQLEEQ